LGFGGLVVELKRRRVFRAMIGWGIFSFAVLQVFEPVMHGLRLPEWTLSAVVVGLAAGFPATMVLAWVFDLGPEGIERTPPVPAGQAPGARLRGARLALVLVALGTLAAVPGLAWYFLRHDRGAAPPATPVPPPLAASAAPSPATPSVAVLPLKNISGDASQDYFGDGMTEEVTSKLSRLRGLAVTARTSAARYRGSEKTAREIGGELGVAYLVEGSVRRAGDRVRVSASLVRTSDAVQVWSEDLDARLDDIFAVQDRLATRIVEALGLKLTPLEASALANWGTRNARAYDEFLKGKVRFEDGGDDPGILKDAMAHFDRALAIDPDFAPALAYRAQATALEYRDFDSSPAVLARADALATRAVALDPQLPEALKAAGDVRANRYDYLGALPLYRRVVEVIPRDHVAQDQLCWALGYAGPPHLEEGEQACRRAQALQPGYFPSHYHLLRIHVQQGRMAEAEADLAALKAANATQLVDAGTFWVAMGAGRPRDALAAVRDRDPTALNFAWQAMALAQVGEVDRAFAALDRAMAGGYADAADLRRSTFWAPLRADPRWAATLARHGIAP
jgi:TolB-like protein